MHPLNVEVIGWASAAPYAPSTFFLFLALLCYLKRATNGLQAPMDASKVDTQSDPSTDTVQLSSQTPSAQSLKTFAP